MAIAGIDALLNDLGLDLDSKRRVMGHVRKSFGAEHHEDAAPRRAFGARYRKESKDLSQQA